MSQRDKLTAEPINVYTWMLLISIFCMGVSIYMVRGILREYYQLEGIPKIFGLGEGLKKINSSK